jgi:hypothetical protein
VDILAPTAETKVLSYTSFQVSWPTSVLTPDVQMIAVHFKQEGQTFKQRTLRPNQTNVIIQNDFFEGGKLIVYITLEVKVGDKIVTGPPSSTMEFVLRPEVTGIERLSNRGSTKGGDTVRITGNNMLTGTKNESNLFVVFGPDHNPNAFDCNVVTASASSITCVVGPGVGKGLKFKVVYDSVESARFSSFLFDYKPPWIEPMSLHLLTVENSTFGRVVGHFPEGSRSNFIIIIFFFFAYIYLFIRLFVYSFIRLFVCLFCLFICLFDLI